MLKLNKKCKEENKNENYDKINLNLNAPSYSPLNYGRRE